MVHRMLDPFTNPFPASDPDRHGIWEMLVTRDIAAFLAADFSMVEDDFVADGFFGIDAGRKANPDHWRLAFPTLEAYRDEWLSQARDFATRDFAEDPRTAIHRTTVLRDIEISGDKALVRKKFDGGIDRADGGRDVMRWQTLYYCRKVEGRFRITGFCGYMPNPLG